MGFTFKENCPDVRNTKVVDVVKHLEDFGVNVTIYDPWVNADEVEHEYSLKALTELPNQKFDAIVQAVSHKEFGELNLGALKNNKSVVYDVKGVLGSKADAKL